MDSYNITGKTWNKLASAYQDKFMNLDLYNDTYDNFCQLIPKVQARILEIGCGPGNITRYLFGKRPDFIIEAIDLAPNMIELARINNPAASFKIMDAREIHTLSTGYDGIMAGFCLPYLSDADCAKLLKDCSGLLNKGGILYLSTIAGDYQKSGYESGRNSQDKMYVYYYPEDYLTEALRVNNFKLINLKRQLYAKPDGTTSTHLIFIAGKIS